MDHKVLRSCWLLFCFQNSVQAVLARDKHTSVCVRRISDGKKSFITLASDQNISTKRKLFFLSVSINFYSLLRVILYSCAKKMKGREYKQLLGPYSQHFIFL